MPGARHNCHALLCMPNYSGLLWTILMINPVEGMVHIVPSSVVTLGAKVIVRTLTALPSCASYRLLSTGIAHDISVLYAYRNESQRTSTGSIICSDMLVRAIVYCATVTLTCRRIVKHAQFSAAARILVSIPIVPLNHHSCAACLHLNHSSDLALSPILISRFPVRTSDDAHVVHSEGSAHYAIALVDDFQLIRDRDTPTFIHSSTQDRAPRCTRRH